MFSKPHPVLRQALWAVVALLALVALQCEAREPVLESDLKAAFVFNFAVFTEWPQEVLPGGAPIILCASPAGAMLASLGALHDKVVNGHRLALRSSAGTPRACHVLVLDKSDRERWAQVKRELAGAGVLTVSDDRVISADGAVIGLTIEAQRIGFDVNLTAARSARVNLSSKLLRLARSVQ